MEWIHKKEKKIKDINKNQTKAQKEKIKELEKKRNAVEIEKEYIPNGKYLDENFFELMDSMRFDVNLDSEYCDTDEKINNQNAYKKFICNLHHKAVDPEEDFEFI